jgi:hypothetical protein
MYAKGKYVVGELADVYNPVYTAVCVNEIVSHSVLKALFVEGGITGAGFFTVSVNKQNGNVEVSVYGESVGLGVKCNPQNDLKWVRRTLGLG